MVFPARPFPANATLWSAYPKMRFRVFGAGRLTQALWLVSPEFFLKSNQVVIRSFYFNDVCDKVKH